MGVNCRALALSTIVVLALVVQQLRIESERVTSAARLDAIHQYEAATEALRTDAARREQSAKVAVVAAQSLAADARQRVSVIKTLPIPRDCPRVIEWLVTEGPGLESDD